MIYETVVIEHSDKQKFEHAVNHVLGTRAGMVAGAGLSRILVKGKPEIMYYCIFIGATLTPEEEAQQFGAKQEEVNITDDWQEFLGEDKKDIVPIV